jgi:hypothetical protein
MQGRDEYNTKIEELRSIRLKEEISKLQDRIDDTTGALKQGYGSPSEIKEWRNDNRVDKARLELLEIKMKKLNK